jgi:hypothetical protein
MLRHQVIMPKDAPSFEAAMEEASIQKIINVWGLDDQGMERVELSKEDQQRYGRELAKMLSARRGTLDALSSTTGPAVVSYETFSMLAELGYVERQDDRQVPQTPCR